MFGRPRVLLAIDREGWAFHNISLALIKHLGDEFEFIVTPYHEIQKGTTVDILVAFWWNSIPMIKSRVSAARTICCIYDGYSWTSSERSLHLLRQSIIQSDAVLLANERFLFDARTVLPKEIQSRPCYVCEDGVDTSAFIYRSLPTTFKVGWCGNSFASKQATGVVDLKGINLIIKACKRAGVPLDFVDAHDGEPRPHSEMPEWYAQFSVLAHMSEKEGTPNPLLEAMSVGRPVIITDVGLVPRIVSHGVNGFVIPRTVSHLVRALQTIQKLDLVRMGRAARYAAEAHDWSLKIKYWRACLHNTLGV